MLARLSVVSIVDCRALSLCDLYVAKAAPDRTSADVTANTCTTFRLNGARGSQAPVKSPSEWVYFFWKGHEPTVATQVPEPLLVIEEVSAALGFENAKPLTQGGQKVVYRGTLGGVDAVAKVVMLSQTPNDSIALVRAHREVELLSAIDSERVVKVLTDAVELGDPTHAICWAEEYLEGEDLRSVMTSAWSESEVWPLLFDMAEALSACHELDVVHRDLSPANVRRTTDGHFVLMDPGLARHLAKTALTGEFQPGTPGWRSPEHVPGGDPIPASDVFALGILAFYALSGEFPIDPNGNPYDYDRALVETQAPRIATIVPTVSDDLAEVIDTCLNRQPARRYLDGTELMGALGRMGDKL